MQDLHDYSITGGGGGGGSTGRFYGGDRRNNTLNHHQSLKCPRCSSLNTKFCYYNNYNLSQPRHFCKNCRRYWTKGGVLRNVPVGGGCRKAKRSKSKQEQPPPSSPPSADEPTTQDVEEKSSSSESSSLTASNSTAATTTAATTTAAAVTAAAVTTATATVNVDGLEWSTLLGQGSSDGGGFSGFTATTETTPFGYGGNSVNGQCIGDDLKLEGNTTVQFGDRTAQIDPSMGFEPLDWGSGGGDQTLFDLTSRVDYAYWSQSQWTSSDHQDDQNGLYLP